MGRPGSPSAVPGWPIVRIELTAEGRAYTDGIPVPRGHAADVRQAAVHLGAGKAIQLGRPIRATATDPDGTIWPLIIHPDGTATAGGNPIAPRRNRTYWRRALTVAAAAAVATAVGVTAGRFHLPHPRARPPHPVTTPAAGPVSTPAPP